METSRAKLATPTRDHVAASSSDAADADADADGKENFSFTYFYTFGAKRCFTLFWTIVPIFLSESSMLLYSSMCGLPSATSCSYHITDIQCFGCPMAWNMLPFACEEFCCRVLKVDESEDCVTTCKGTHTNTAVLRPFVRDNPGGPVPQETFTQSHLKRVVVVCHLSLIHISEPTRQAESRMPSSA